MNWNDLSVFLAIAEQGSLAGAARDLKINHSTVFRRLNSLESDLDTRLFDRLPDGYVLTPVGERMRELALEVEAAIQSIEREVAGRDLEPCGTVRLTTAPNIARTIVPGVLKKLRRTHPQIIVETSVGDSDYDLNRREADIALRATTRPPEHLVGRKLAELGWSVCGATSSRRRQPKNIPELQGQPVVGADASMMRLAAFQWLESNFREQIVARANDLSTMAALARADVGFAVLPSDQKGDGLRRLFTVPGIGGELWLLTHPDLRNVRRIRVVWDALAEAAGNL
ncbi:MAG: LysR family transcriptional regulator [Gammaproteobacteria bacterium]|nr:LysR family transcriptional regulator [Gammaproteobacteria bacterium]